MVKNLFTILFTLIVAISNAQNFKLNDKNINELNSKIKALEKIYKQKKPLVLNSFPQTTANYFELTTKTPEIFIQSLAKTNNFNQLVNLHPNLLIDKDILIIKNVYVGYQKDKKIDINSFNIGNGDEHRITLNYSDSLNNSNLKFFYTKYTYKNTTTIFGFYLNSPFKSVAIPQKYTNWINYNDILIEPKTPIFIGEQTNPFKSIKLKANAIDTLVSHFNTKTNKPSYKANADQKAFYKKLETWQSKKKQFADSLYKKDKKFKELLNNALSYAEKNYTSNPDLEDLTYFVMPKNRTLNLLRQKQIVGSCSFDEEPVTQLKKIALLAAETGNWNLFIKAILNVLNDNVSSVAKSNIASQQRSTYAEELAKLDINLDYLLLGSNFKIADSSNVHYFSDGDKIAQAYANLNTTHQQLFEKTILDILKNPTIDVFNKLHFYNTYLNYKYFIKDSLKISKINKEIKKITQLLPFEIKSRIENPNKLLTDMLHNEDALLSNFIIKSSTVGTIYSYNYGGKCWKAQLIEKGANPKIIYDLTMPIDEYITPLKNFTIKMDSLKYYVTNNQFLQKKLNEHPKSRLYIEFTKDRSFANYQNVTTKVIPSELMAKMDFTGAISTYIENDDHNYARYILLKNNNVLSIKSSISLDKKDNCKLYNEKGDEIY